MTHVYQVEIIVFLVEISLTVLCILLINASVRAGAALTQNPLNMPYLSLIKIEEKRFVLLDETGFISKGASYL